MAELVIRDERIASELLNAAQQESRTVEEMVEMLLREHRRMKPEDTSTQGTFSVLAKAAEEAGLGLDSEPTDTSERSREILNNEYAEYLKRRIDGQ